MLAADRWEQGSEYHLFPFAAAGPDRRDPWGDDALLVGSGRDALRLLLADGMAHRGWRRLWVPSYFCPDVVHACGQGGVEVLAYECGPLNPERLPDPALLREGDVVLVVNLFGMRVSGAPPAALPDFVQVIEDHTHDPWSDWAAASGAHWCIASLRKTIPVPDGGVIWSPRGLPLPARPAVDEGLQRWSAQKLAAMGLKRLYLEGAPIDKSVYRAMMVEAEENLGTGALSAISPAAEDLLRAFPVKSWRERRRANHHLLSAELERVPGLEVLRGQPGSVPLSVPVLFADHAARETVRRRLVEQRIYPALLWVLTDVGCTGVPVSHRQLGERLLFLHCDARYTGDDLRRVATALRAIVDALLPRTAP